MQDGLEAFMKFGKLALAVGVTGCLLGAGPAALAASPPKGGKIRIFVTNTSATKAKILVTGAIGDFGTTISQDANGKADPNGDFQKVILKHGGFLVDGTALNKKLNSARPTINTTNCSIVFSGTGPTTVKDGTGAYAGISGKVTITVTFAGIAPKTAKGCNLANNAPTFGQYQSITGAGTVSFK
jgi:hypothetical protein